MWDLLYQDVRLIAITEQLQYILFSLVMMQKEKLHQQTVSFSPTMQFNL